MALALLLAALGAAAGIAATAVARNGNWLGAAALALFSVLLLASASITHFGRLKVPGLRD
jgi:hypothetical protein